MAATPLRVLIVEDSTADVGEDTAVAAMKAPRTPRCGANASALAGKVREVLDGRTSSPSA